MTRVQIAGIAAYLPPDVLTSAEVEARIRAHSPGPALPSGLIEALTGIRARRIAAEGVHSSDLAAEAAKRVLSRTGTHPREVDLLIYAAASQDLIEPATANIVQEKTGTSCPVFDLKNACNSFLNAVQVGASLIQSGAHRTVLIATGETPSRGINWRVRDRAEFKRGFLGYTLGDAGAAALLRPADDERGIFYQSFRTISRHWDLATLPGGGSMHPRGDEWATFRGDSVRLKQAFLAAGPGILRDALAATETSFADYQRVFVHQVSMPALDGFVALSRAPREKVEVTVPDLGNMAAASMPVAFAQAEARGAIRRGDLAMWIGLAAGISLGVMLMRY
jgi:3-oxoacyl-[acyl-carrier-protein] synthase-3